MMSMRITVVFVMSAFKSLGDENSSEVGKDIGLQKCN